MLVVDDHHARSTLLNRLRSLLGVVDRAVIAHLTDCHALRACFNPNIVYVSMSGIFVIYGPIVVVKRLL